MKGLIPFVVFLLSQLAVAKVDAIPSKSALDGAGDAQYEFPLTAGEIEDKINEALRAGLIVIHCVERGCFDIESGEEWFVDEENVIDRNGAIYFMKLIEENN